jgi:hypothetical protein
MVDREALRRQQSELEALRHSIAFKKGWLIGFAVWFALLFLIGVASTNGDLEGAIVIALVFSLPYVMLWLLVVMGVAIAFETRNPPPIIVRTYKSVHAFERDAPRMVRRGYWPQGMVQPGRGVLNQGLRSAGGMLVGEMLLGPVGLLAGLAASFAGRKRVAVTWVRRGEEPATEPQAADSIALG